MVSGAATEWEHRPARPQVYTSREGLLTAVFERSPSVPSRVAEARAPAILEVVFSRDGGLTWSAPESVGVGHDPQLAVSAGGETGVLFYGPESGAPREAIRWVHKKQGAPDFDPSVTLSQAPALTVPRGLWGEHGEVAHDGPPSLSAHAELFFAAWVKKGVNDRSQDQIVTARASRVSSFSHLEVELKGKASTSQRVSMTVRAVNNYFMPVAAEGTVELSHGAAHVDPSEELDLRFSLHSGVGHAVLPIAQRQRGFGPNNAALSVRFTHAQEGIETTSLKHVVLKSADGNYATAIATRDRLLRHQAAMEEPAEFYYQVEYLPSVPDDTLGAQARPSEPSENLSAQDAHHLAGFERVWAYTQGITLAQLATSPSGYGPKARGMARYLCHRAVRKPNSEVIMGWPFSWNTKNDDWEDARLVTGANAWVIHGIGVFLASQAYREATLEDQEMLKACYHDGLDGLQEHRRRLPVNERRMGSLMSAGWTTRGLQNVGAPHRLRDEDAGEFLFPDLDSNHRFSYYSVLDAIGYKAFSPTQILVCGRGAHCDGRPFHSAAWQTRAIDQEAEWAVLKARIPAQNVVTEHSLDVLQVLNHALTHSESLGPKGRESRHAWTQRLERWRNELRDGVFFLLWDAHGWREEFANTLAQLEGEASPAPLTEAQAERKALRIQAMREALDAYSLGRVITGGTLHSDGAKGVRFEANAHTAIDNCSWLALSVEDDLDSLYAERLGRCLQYTVIQFVKDLSAGDEDCDPAKAQCPPRRTYRGTHYFQNAFKDPYIEPSALQESSYHLEATMGLILGLLKFSRAHPDDPRALAFLKEARQLWTGAQSFVRDHGFVYSSQRIQNLSTRMVSSTALVWFIDVYRNFAKNDSTITLLSPGQDLENAVLVERNDSIILTGWRQHLTAPLKEAPAVKAWRAWLGLGSATTGSVIAEQLRGGVSMLEAHESYCRDRSITLPAVTHGFLWGCMDLSKADLEDPWPGRVRRGNGSPAHPFRSEDEAHTWLKFFSVGDSTEVGGLFGLSNDLSKFPAIVLEPGGTERHFRPRFEPEGPFDHFVVRNVSHSASSDGRTYGPAMNMLPTERGGAQVFLARDLGPAEDFVVFCSHNPNMFDFDPGDSEKLEKVLHEHKHDIFIPLFHPRGSGRFDLFYDFHRIDHPHTEGRDRDRGFYVSDGFAPGLPMVCVTLSTTQVDEVLIRLLSEDRLNEIRYRLLSHLHGSMNSRQAHSVGVRALSPRGSVDS